MNWFRSISTGTQYVTLAVENLECGTAVMYTENYDVTTEQIVQQLPKFWFLFPTPPIKLKLGLQIGRSSSS
jgi:hypothetical protein